MYTHLFLYCFYFIVSFIFTVIFCNVGYNNPFVHIRFECIDIHPVSLPYIYTHMFHFPWILYLISMLEMHHQNQYQRYRFPLVYILFDFLFAFLYVLFCIMYIFFLKKSISILHHHNMYFECDFAYIYSSLSYCEIISFFKQP